MSARAPITAAQERRNVPAVHGRHVRLLATLAGLVAFGMLVGFAFSGSPDTLAAGTRIAGFDVGGLTPHEAATMLAQRSAALAHVPVTFVVGDRSFSIRPDELGVKTDWDAAVATAETKGQGMDILRGFRRLELRFFPENVVPKVHAYQAAVNYELSVIAAKVDHPFKPARLVRHGLVVKAVPGRTGEELVRKVAAAKVIAALASLSRPAGAIDLPMVVAQPNVTAAQLAGAQAQARKALSAPVTLEVGSQRFTLTPTQIAPMLQLPHNAHGQIVLGGTAADTYFSQLDKTVGRPAHGAGFSAYGDHVSVVPAQAGLALDVPKSAVAVLAAAEQTTGRVAHLSVTSASVGRTTAEATAMGITGVVSTYETFYGGVPNRIHNVELVAHLVDNKLIAPGATFSFNGATGERTAAKGFLEAPVIMNGEVETGLGGGVCQVSTTVFNAAYEGGLPITARTNHALYISHYPLGRDATVDYPDVDLKFVNDTPHWLLLRTFVGSDSLVVTLYGAPQHRRVVSTTAPLTQVAPAPIKRVLNKDLAPGTQLVEDYGSPAYTTSVQREVYSSDGKLLSDATWYSNYRSSPEIVEIGPKPKPVVKPPPVATTTTTTTTTPVTSTPDPGQGGRAPTQ